MGDVRGAHRGSAQYPTNVNPIALRIRVRRPPRCPTGEAPVSNSAFSFLSVPAASADILPHVTLTCPLALGTSPRKRPGPSILRPERRAGVRGPGR